MPVHIKNKKAYVYDFTYSLIAGMVLTGAEAKSIREGKVTFNGAVITLTKDSGKAELFGLDIQPYSHSHDTKHEISRPKSLLLTKRDLFELKELSQKGYRFIPTELLEIRGKYKIVVSIGKPIKKSDVRNKELEKEHRKQMKTHD